MSGRVGEAVRDLERITRIEEKLDVVRRRLNELLEFEQVDRLYEVAGLLEVLRRGAELDVERQP